MQKRLSLPVPRERCKAVLRHILSPTCSIYLRKDYSIKERREALSNLCLIFDVAGIHKEKILNGLQNEDFLDFEDCLQMECAKAYKAEYIVTGNIDDYKMSKVKAILPNEFLAVTGI